VKLVFNKRIITFAVFILACIPLFYDLGEAPIYRIDESRLALNALEMHKSDDFLVTYYNGEPDHWNTKPPLMIWAQVAFMKVLGPTELAIRLPSALAGLLTCVLLFYFCAYHLKNFWLGCLTVLILITTQGYIAVHVTRSGDYDALLTLFSTAACLYFYLFLEKNRSKFLYVFFVTLTLGVLTKGITILIFSPALLLFCTYKQKLVSLITNKHFYLGLLGLVAVVSAYYITREASYPGYLQAVYDNELGGRYTRALTEIEGGPLYYIKNLGEQLYSWLPFPFLGLLLIFNKKLKRYHSLIVFTFLILLMFYGVISFSATKLPWYDAPLMPFFSILSALFITTAMHYIYNKLETKSLSSLKYLPHLLVTILFLFAYVQIGRKVKVDDHTDWYAMNLRMELFLKKAMAQNDNLDGYFTIYDGYQPQIEFYENLIRANGVKLIHRDISMLKQGDKIISFQPENIKAIKDKFIIHMDEELDSVFKIKLLMPVKDSD